MDVTEFSPNDPILEEKTRHGYTRQELIDQLRNLNDQYPGKVTRHLVRTQTDIFEPAYLDWFGNFSEYVRQSGLKETRYTTKINSQVARNASVEVMKTLGDERKSYGSRYLRDHGGRYRTMMACSDLHDKEIDPFFHRVWISTVKMIQPDNIVYDGDIFDCPEFGRFDQHPRDWDAAGRIKFMHNFFHDTRNAAPDAQVDFIEGNHEGRLIKHIFSESPGIADIMGRVHEWTIPKIFGLDQFEMNYIGQAELTAHTDAALKREVYEKNYKRYYGCVLAHHFPKGKSFGMPGFNGHHHKHEVTSLRNAHYGAYEWHQMGTGHKRNASYTDGSIWNNGFLIINVDVEKRRPIFDYVYVGDTMAVAGGTFYYRQPEEYYPALVNEMNIFE